MVEPPPVAVVEAPAAEADTAAETSAAVATDAATPEAIVAPKGKSTVAPKKVWIDKDFDADVAWTKFATNTRYEATVIFGPMLEDNTEIKGTIMGKVLAPLKHNNPTGLGGRHHYWIPFNRLVTQLREMDYNDPIQTIWASCRNLKERSLGDHMLEFMISEHKSDDQGCTTTAYIRPKAVGLTIDEKGITLALQGKGKGKANDQAWKSWNDTIWQNAPATTKTWVNYDM
jgi:hypothetical protein